MSDNGSVRTVRLDVHLGDARFRVLVEDPEVGATLAEALEPWRAEPGDARVGFVVKEPNDIGGLHIVVDRSGLVLGRARTPHEAAQILLSVLRSFEPRPAGTHRVRLRSLADDADGLVIAGFPLFVMPTPIERQIERTGHRLVDRLAVDVDDRLVVASSTSTIPTIVDGAIVGHVADVGGRILRKLLIPSLGQLPPTQAEVVAFVAGNLITDDPAPGFDLAERIARLPHEVLPADADTPPYRALTRS